MPRRSLAHKAPPFQSSGPIPILDKRLASQNAELQAYKTQHAQRVVNLNLDILQGMEELLNQARQDNASARAAIERWRAVLEQI